MNSIKAKTETDEKRRTYNPRRAQHDRRQNFDPDYSGPARRLIIDRRENISDRRKDDNIFS